MRISAAQQWSAVALLFIGAASAFSPPLAIVPRRTSTRVKLQEKQQDSSTVMEEANEALTSVGWAPPSSDEELTSDDPFVRQIDASIQQDVGVSLDELLNPAKVSFYFGIVEYNRVCVIIVLTSILLQLLLVIKGCQFGTRLVQFTHGIGGRHGSRDGNGRSRNYRSM